MFYLKLQKLFRVILLNNTVYYIESFINILFFIVIYTQRPIKNIESICQYFLLFIAIHIIILYIYMYISNLYNYSLFYSSYRNKIFLIYLKHIISYSIKNCLIMYSLFIILSYNTLDINLCFLYELLFYFVYIILLSFIFFILFENKIWIILIFIFNLLLYLISTKVINIEFFDYIIPSITCVYKSSLKDPFIIWFNLLILIFISSFLFKFKRRK